MAKNDFDSYVNGLRLTVGEDALALTQMKEALAKGETDECMYRAAERALKDDKYRLGIFLFAKGLLDKPTRKRKIKAWERQSKLPKTMPTKE